MGAETTTFYLLSAAQKNDTLNLIAMERLFYFIVLHYSRVLPSSITTHIFKAQKARGGWVSSWGWKRPSMGLLRLARAASGLRTGELPSPRIPSRACPAWAWPTQAHGRRNHYVLSAVSCTKKCYTKLNSYGKAFFSSAEEWPQRDHLCATWTHQFSGLRARGDGSTHC